MRFENMTDEELIRWIERDLQHPRAYELAERLRTSQNAEYDRGYEDGRTAGFDDGVRYCAECGDMLA